MRKLKPLALVLACGSAIAQTDVLTANYDNNRTSANLNERNLTTTNVNPTQFGRLFALPVDGQVYAQPLYVHALSFGNATHNVVYVATMHNSMYAFDADASGAPPLWHMNLGPSVNPASFAAKGEPAYTDILHEVGILSTPVIDRDGSTIYAVSETLTGGNDAFYLHALDLITGHEKLNSPIEIEAAVSGAGWLPSETVNGQLIFRPQDHIQRPGLLFANNSVYVAFGSHGDHQPWHGWVMAYSAASLQQTAVFCATPSAAGAAIWQSGRGLAADSNGDLYLATGNGSYDGMEAWGEAVLHLTPSLTVADWFTPADYAAWTADDADLGSSGPILVPGANLLIAGGKSGVVAVVDRTQMGHEMANDTEAVETFQAVSTGLFEIFNAALWNRPDGPLLYVWGFGDYMRAFRMTNGMFDSKAYSVGTQLQTSLPFPGLTVSSNQFLPGTGILWATSGPGASFPMSGTVHALDASDVGHELWNSDMSGNRDTLGSLTKFANPTVVNGKVYVPTDSRQVMVYGLLPVPGILAVVSAASFLPSSVAPGELISLFGNHIGPATPMGLRLTPQGLVSTSLEGVQVTFDGTPAPLLYVSANQINVVTPFAIASRSSTQIQVTQNGASYSYEAPVSAAAPAIFSADSSGAGQGAILNSDLSPNSPTHPATRGSTVAIYATGTGTLQPAVADGTLVRANTLPMAASPISVTIGGQSATVAYQGGAPGLVAGVMQVNATVPNGITPGPSVPVVLSVAGTDNLNTITMAVQ